MAVEATAFARAGLVGNPSDGYHGKTISFIIRNFWAKVSLYENAEIEFVPSFQDRSKYKTLNDLLDDVRLHGYYGGIRLMKATVKRFVEYCEENQIPLHDRKFSLRYRSTIPRRVGLAGSSALVTATLRCLLDFYEVEIAQPQLPNLILSVENAELGISAGLQDRVIQVYEGLVYMNFDKEIMERQGFGVYEQLEPKLLPNMYLAYRTDLAEGSEVFHNNMRERWNQGEPDMIQAMKDFAGYAEEVRNLLLAGNGHDIGQWLDKNFDRRRSLMKLDPRNIEMVERARSAGASAKFAGSGGAIIGTYTDEAMYDRLVEVFKDTTTEVLKPEIAPEQY